MHVRWRGVELPSVVDCDRKTLTNTYGKFMAERTYANSGLLYRYASVIPMPLSRWPIIRLMQQFKCNHQDQFMVLAI